MIPCHYVMGFAFDIDRRSLLLIEKKRPDWMAGNWNGIGGHWEEVDAEKGGSVIVIAQRAMRREFKEETGLDFGAKRWQHCITMNCAGGIVYVFTIYDNGIEDAQSLTDELVERHHIGNLPPNVMDNLLWMIPLCMGEVRFPVSVTQNFVSTPVKHPFIERDEAKGAEGE